LGAAATEFLVRSGARVVVADLAPHPSSSSSSSSPSRSAGGGNGDPTRRDDGGGGAVAYARTDVTDPDQVSEALDLAERCYGEPVTAAINCAGIGLARKTLSKKGHPHPLDEFVRTLTVNAVGTFNVSRLAAERMSRREFVDGDDGDRLRGCIINTASIAAYEGQVGQVAYAASKGAVVGMTLPMARDLAPLGIRVVTIVRIRRAAW